MKASLFAAALVLSTAAAAASAAGPRDRVSVVGETFGHRGRWKTPTLESTGTEQGFQLFCRGIGQEMQDSGRPALATRW